MNVSEKCGWTEHLLAEYGKAIHLGFQGIHMDTYGFPKHVWDVQGKSVDLAQEFPKLIDCAADAVSQTEKEAGVIFNAVNDGPRRQWPLPRRTRSILKSGRPMTAITISIC